MNRGVPDALSRSDDDNHEESATPAIWPVHCLGLNLEIAIFLCLFRSLRIFACGCGDLHVFLISPSLTQFVFD